MVLVVDDQEDMRVVMEMMLRHSGYRVASVDSGSAAIDFVKSNKPSCLLLDFNMPFMDGLTVLRQIRSDSSLETVRVIMYTAADPSIQQECLQAGADGFIQKGTFDWEKAKMLISRFSPPERFPAN